MLPRRKGLQLSDGQCRLCCKVGEAIDSSNESIGRKAKNQERDSENNEKNRLKRLERGRASGSAPGARRRICVCRDRSRQGREH